MKLNGDLRQIINMILQLFYYCVIINFSKRLTNYFISSYIFIIYFKIEEVSI